MENTNKRVSVWQNRGASDENQPLHCFGEDSDGVGRHRAGDLNPPRPEVPSKRRSIAVNKGCLQESRRRCHRRKPRWFSSTNEVKKRLSGVDLRKPALSRTNELQLNTIKRQN